MPEYTVHVYDAEYGTHDEIYFYSEDEAYTLIDQVENNSLHNGSTVALTHYGQELHIYETIVTA